MEPQIHTADHSCWYALYTLPRREKKVAEVLRHHHIENYCPLNRVIKQWSDRKKVVEEPLFSSYVFVRVSEKEKWVVKDIKGVLNYVYWQGKPAIIPERDIDKIKRFLNEHQQIEVQPLRLNSNDHVRILAGPFMHMDAKVISQKGKRVVVEIASLGVSLTANIYQNDLEIISYSRAVNF